MRALVSAADVTDVLGTHADRVHDAARRLGCTAEEAAEVTEEAAVDLIESLARRPETVGDLVGALYARCLALSERVRTAEGLGPIASDSTSTALLAEARQNATTSAALDALPDRRRLAVLLRDSYGLDPEQASVAVGLDAAEVARTVALGRLALVAAVDDRIPPSLAGHDFAVGDLGQLADGSAVSGGRFAALRRHVSGCPTCAEVLDVQTRARALVGALPILALPDAARDALLRRCATQAASALPSAADIAAELGGEIEEPRLFPRFVVAGLLLLAALLGAGTGRLLATNHLAAPPATAGSAATVVVTAGAPVVSTAGPTPSTFATRTESPTPISSSPPPSASSRSPSATRTTPPVSSTSSTPAAAISLSPTAGPSGTVITVSGSGFQPGSRVQLTYGRQAGGPPTSRSSARVAADGTFTTTVTANDSTLALPPHVVTATAGPVSASATFNQTG